MKSSAKWIIFLFSLWLNYNSVKSIVWNIDLDGTWVLKNVEKGYNYSVTVPGGVYSDLMRHKVIEDVYFGFNDVKSRWVSKTNWTYSRTFDASPYPLNDSDAKLIFDGIDTFATVLINDIQVGTTENMFVKYIFDIKQQLKPGENKIEVQFKSPVNVAKDVFDKQSESYAVVPLCVPEEYNGECHVNHIRKMQASFSWDWGPALPSVGIWKRVYIDIYTVAVIDYVTTKITSNSGVWIVEFHVYLSVSAELYGDSIKGTIAATIETDAGYQKYNSLASIKLNSNGEYEQVFVMQVQQRNVQTWWPNGYGEAKLYNVNVTFTDVSNTHLHKKDFRIGFRKVELVQEKIAEGRSFYFKVNDVPIFAKGSNSIPINILPELGQNEDTIRFLLQSAKDVHMNMLRVWGGGTYESDFFYDIADEMGILIWQDFMFACSMYPATPNFLSNVQSEVKHQVRRLQNHPSIVLWAGNNENEAALQQNWYGTKDNYTQFKIDYVKLYVDTIQEEVKKNDGVRPYLISSPTNGIKSIEDGYIADNPQSHFYGDVHFYNYVNDSWDTRTYPINRFASEYGYQSLPSINTWRSATNNATDLEIFSAFLKHRQHLPEGYEKMDALIGHRLALPSNNTVNYMQTYIYFSQIIQAMAVKIETEYNRQWRSIQNEEGKGRTMGALYWQLNDVWVAPTWSGIDFKNNWKMMQYYARHFFAPIIVTGDLAPDGTLDLYVVSDLKEAVTEITLTIYGYEWKSFTPIRTSTKQIDIFPGSSEKLLTFFVDNYFSYIDANRCGEDSKNCFLYFTLTNSTNETVAPDNYIFPVPLKNATLEKQSVNVAEIVKIYEDKPYFALKIEASGIALFVWLEAKGIRGRFSDNGFQQVIPTKIIRFIPEDPYLTLPEFEKSVTITHFTEHMASTGASFEATLRIKSISLFVISIGAILFSKFIRF